MVDVEPAAVQLRAARSEEWPLSGVHLSTVPQRPILGTLGVEMRWKRLCGDGKYRRHPRLPLCILSGSPTGCHRYEKSVERCVHKNKSGPITTTTHEREQPCAALAECWSVTAD